MSVDRCDKSSIWCQAYLFHFDLEKFSASWETFQQGHSKHSHTVQICNNLSWCFSSSRLKNIQARILPKRFDNILIPACAITWLILKILNCTTMLILVISAMQINLLVINFMMHQMAHNFINLYIVVFLIHTTLLYIAAAVHKGSADL